MSGTDGKTKAEATAKLWDMIKDIKYAMLTTEDGDHLRARPMAASQTDFDGTLWFYTRASSHKVEEIDADSRVGVTYSDPSSANYVSLSGTARLVQDRAAIQQHWSEWLTTWFPKGSEDPDVAILKVDVSSAEYWDAPNGTMLHAYGYLKAKLTGEPPHPGGNEKIDLK